MQPGDGVKHRRRFLGNRPLLRLLFVIIVVGLALFFWRTQHRKVNSLRPEKTKRAIASRPVYKPIPLAEEPTIESIESDDEEITPVMLWIYPRADGSWRYPRGADYQIGPQNYWPMEDEAPWPDIESADALQILAERLRTGEGPLAEAAGLLVLQAQEDGLLDDEAPIEFDDPWTGLIAMQAEYVETVLQTGLWPEDGTVDFSRNLGIADFIIETWPDDPSAEYARLHLLQISNHPGSTRHNTDDTVEWIVDIIENTQDSLVLDVAIGEFTTIENSTFDESTIKVIADVFEETEINTQRGIIRAMLNHHANTENWSQVEAWTHRLTEHEKQVRWDEEDKTHMNTQSVLSDLAGYRAVRGDHKPEDWRTEVSAVVHLCHEDHPIDTSLGGEAEWEDGWQWNAWWEVAENLWDTQKQPESPNFMDCLRNNDWQYAPSQATLLTIKVIR